MLAQEDSREVPVAGAEASYKSWKDSASLLTKEELPYFYPLSSFPRASESLEKSWKRAQVNLKLCVCGWLREESTFRKCLAETKLAHTIFSLHPIPLSCLSLLTGPVHFIQRLPGVGVCGS